MNVEEKQRNVQYLPQTSFLPLFTQNRRKSAGRIIQASSKF